ncbi:CBS domain-containing protein [Methanococcus maripaludis]|uniref:CBS domain-containing protein n=1 Tax=Methanococcus maripaludis TaxID=39152 RepID=A0A7J9NQV6_METMI|nr:CBS domain-containing protein [Methanococcus maripaludis]MBA2847148.1 CBS domain-containing protein [Methanococcus maripaludis]
MNLELSVTEAMSTPVATVTLDTTAYDVANILKDKGIGCLVVLNDAGKPVGIITERDLALGVVSRNLKSKEVIVEEISSSKLIAIAPKSTLMDAARKMDTENVKRLPVIDGDELLGIVTVSDITKLSPELFSIMVETNEIHNSEYPYSKNEEIEGICEICGSTDRVNYINGRYICKNCNEDSEGEEE